MKKNLLLLLFVSFCSMMYASYAVDNPIDLTGMTGSTPKGPTRVKAVVPSVLAHQYSDYVTVNFFRDLGTVTTTVYNEFGEVVYQNQTASAYGVVEIIDTTGFEEGEYTIVIDNNSGTHLEGNFVL